MDLSRDLRSGRAAARLPRVAVAVQLDGDGVHDVRLPLDPRLALLDVLDVPIPVRQVPVPLPENRRVRTNLPPSARSHISSTTSVICHKKTHAVTLGILNAAPSQSRLAAPSTLMGSQGSAICLPRAFASSSYLLLHGLPCMISVPTSRIGGRSRPHAGRQSWPRDVATANQENVRSLLTHGRPLRHFVSASLQLISAS